MYNFAYQRARSLFFRNIRNFFMDRDYLEVFTPTLSDSLIPEPTIRNFGTRFINEFMEERDLYMIPSPEIFMKRMMAEGSGSIFQISQCFRNAEQLGRIHNPEFTMLEYYTIGYDEMDSLELTKEFLKETAIGDCAPSVLAEPLVITVEEACMKWSGLDLMKAQDYSFLREHAESRGLYVPDGEPWDDTFNRIFITDVETNLPDGRPVILTDYPEQIDCLAEKKKDRPYRSRWEMYIDGTEIANTYKEETDKQIIRKYYEKEYRRLVELRKDTGDVIPAADMSFCDIDMPASSGVAIGLDRLLMAELGEKEIGPLLAFPMSAMLKV